MRITRSTLRRLIAEESARLLREAAEEEVTATNEAERGKKGKKRGGADCLYVLYGGRGVYCYTAPCGLSEEEASEKGRDVTDDVVGGEDMATSLSLYDWLQRHDEITAVYDDESVGGEVSKDDYMAHLEDVARQDGLLADDEFVNEEADEPLDESEDLDEMTDDAYNDDLQSRHGRFTTPENVKGTPQHKAAHGPYVSDRRGAPSTPMGPASAEELERIRARRGDSLANLPLNPYDGPNSPDSAYYDLREGAFPEELEGIYGEEPPDFGKRGSRDDSFMDYDPEEIPDMDDQYDPEYYEGLDDEEDDEDFMDYETGDDDVPYGAADVALRMGRGHRTDEGDDLYEGDSQGDDDMGYEDDADYEHAYSMGGGSDEEGFAIDYDTGRPSPFAAKMFGQPAAGADDIEGGDADEDVFGDDDMGRRGAMDDYRHALKLGGGRDEDGFAADYDTGKRSRFPSARGGMNESIDMLSAGIGAIVGIAALYAAGPLSRVATNILNTLSDAQRSAAMDKAREKAGTEMAEAIENLSRDTKLVALFRELEAAQEDGTSREAREKSKEITAYISEKRKDMSFGHGDAQLVRRGVAKRLKKGDDDKGDKLDEARWAKLAGILKG